MSVRLAGSVGKYEIEWLEIPASQRGKARARVSVAGKVVLEDTLISWNVDESGVTLAFGEESAGFEVRSQLNDDGAVQFDLVERGGGAEYSALRFVRKGEEASGAGRSDQKRSAKIKAQMPGKIVKVLVTPQQKVSKDQPLLIMEAMKMENEIRATADGVVSQVSVVAGQAVESGAVLVVME